MLTDAELAEIVIERLHDFDPALTIEEGEDNEQVIVHIIMNRDSKNPTVGMW